MYVKDGIAYAGEQTSAIRISGVRPLEDFRLWIRFNTGEAKVFNFAPLLSKPAYAPLADKAIFNAVYIDYGVTVWNNGDIDISPETLYRDGVATDDAVSA